MLVKLDAHAQSTLSFHRSHCLGSSVCKLLGYKQELCQYQITKPHDLSTQILDVPPASSELVLVCSYCHHHMYSRTWQDQHQGSGKHAIKTDTCTSVFALGKYKDKMTQWMHDIHSVSRAPTTKWTLLRPKCRWRIALAQPSLR